MKKFEKGTIFELEIIPTEEIKNSEVIGRKIFAIATMSTHGTHRIPVNIYPIVFKDGGRLFQITQIFFDEGTNHQECALNIFTAGKKVRRTNSKKIGDQVGYVYAKCKILKEKINAA